MTTFGIIPPSKPIPYTYETAVSQVSSAFKNAESEITDILGPIAGKIVFDNIVTLTILNNMPRKEINNYYNGIFTANSVPPEHTNLHWVESKIGRKNIIGGYNEVYAALDLPRIAISSSPLLSLAPREIDARKILETIKAEGACQKDDYASCVNTALNAIEKVYGVVVFGATDDRHNSAVSAEIRLGNNGGISSKDVLTNQLTSAGLGLYIKSNGNKKTEDNPLILDFTPAPYHLGYHIDNVQCATIKILSDNCTRPAVIYSPSSPTSYKDAGRLCNEFKEIRNGLIGAFGTETGRQYMRRALVAGARQVCPSAIPV